MHYISLKYCGFSKSRVVVRAGRYIEAEIRILKDLDRRQVICKQWKISSGAEKLIRITGILMMTTKHIFPQDLQCLKPLKVGILGPSN